MEPCVYLMIVSTNLVIDIFAIYTLSLKSITKNKSIYGQIMLKH